MSNLVFVTGDFCSGSTLLFTLFRKAERFHCLYEPLHELIPEFMVYGLRPDSQDHHFFVDSYYDEWRGFDRARALYNPRWGNADLYLPPEADGDDLYRYLSYIIGMSFGRAPRVMMKENRLPFRLQWIRAKFPGAKIVHIHRPKEDQWKSIVRRVQLHHGREDVGQDKPGFTGFNIHAWCEDLKPRFPELDVKRFTSGFDRFSALWQLSFDANRKDSDISIDYRDLQRHFVPTMERMWQCIGVTDVDTPALERYVVQQEGKKGAVAGRGLLTRARDVVDRVGRKYARVRVRTEAKWRGGA
jgi:Sulfotransferase family